jgi:peptidoglycan lytic transglycosylase
MEARTRLKYVDSICLMSKVRWIRLAIYLGCCLAVLAFWPAHLLRAPSGPGSNPTVGAQTALEEAAMTPIHSWTTVATWYGRHFAGHETANGDTFDMNAPTAAHPTLPLGSMIRVTNPRTGRSLVVTVNDRGPYVEGRGLDVSYQAARKLGILQQGLARVRIELLKVPRHWPRKDSRD